MVRCRNGPAAARRGQRSLEEDDRAFGEKFKRRGAPAQGNRNLAPVIEPAPVGAGASPAGASGQDALPTGIARERDAAVAPRPCRSRCPARTRGNRGD
jgi:hypothetical protein